MKTKQIFMYGLIAVIMALAFTTCDDGTGGEGDDDGPSFLGDKLELSGQVYELSVYPYGIYYDEIFASLGINDSSAGGSGAITNGKLAYTIGTPDSTSLESNDFFGFDEGWTNIQTSDSDVKIFMLELLLTNPLPYYFDYNGVVKANITDMIAEIVVYVYVDGDITISGTGKTQTLEDGYTYITSNFSLALKEGWNAMCMKQTDTETTQTISISQRNPNFKWVLMEIEPFGNPSVVAPPSQEQRSLSGAPAAGNFRFKPFKRIQQRTGD
jgi:hypothetical protein